MSRAEDIYLEHFQDGRLRNCSSKDVFLLGYHQAEKDLELTWENIKLISEIIDDVTVENLHNNKLFAEDYYKEILKRYKDYKERKEK